MSEEEKKENFGEILENDEGFKGMMNLFKEKSFFQRMKSIVAGLSMPADSKEYKEARTNLQRLMAPVLAVVIPLVLILLLVVLSKSTGGTEVITEVEVIEVEEVEELEDIEEPEPPETFDDFTPTDVDFTTPNMNVDVATEVAPDVPVTAQPQSFDAVTPIKSPVILKNIFGSTRNPGMRGQMLQAGGGNAKTEATVMRALRWLKVHQSPDGSWPNNKVAMTGLAILTYLAHGEKPGESPEFGETVQKALEFLLSVQNKEGLYTKGGNGYAHAIATYAMCEAYGMTMNPNVRESADRALEIIINGQHPSGGWDYNWKQSERDDTSVMGWCAQALKAGMMADFYHDPEALDRASKLSVKGFKKNGFPDGGFGYTAPQRGGLTGVGVLCMQFHNAANDPYVKNSLDNIIYQWKPAWIGSTPKNPVNKKPEDLPPGTVGGSCPQYYYYYATQAVFQSGGERWKKWNNDMWPSYVAAQFIIPKGQLGSAVCNCGHRLCKRTVIGKDPITPYIDHEGNEQEIGHWVNTDAHGDRPVMDTCLAALQMMVYYRYLPTFAKVNVPKEVEAETTDTGDIEIDSNL